MVGVRNEPVATAGITTALASLIVIVGQSSGWWSVTSDQATAGAVGVVGIVGIISTLIARRHVTPIVKTSAPPASGA